MTFCKSKNLDISHFFLQVFEIPKFAISNKINTRTALAWLNFLPLKIYHLRNGEREDPAISKNIE